MKKLITLSIAILLSISSFATENPKYRGGSPSPFAKKILNKNGLVTMDKEKIKTKFLLVGAGATLFTTGLVLHQFEVKNNRNFEGPGIGIGPNQLLQGLGIGTICLGITIKF